MPVQLALAELSAGDDCRAEITEAREIAEVHILTQSKEKLGGKAPIMKPARGTCGPVRAGPSPILGSRREKEFKPITDRAKEV